jgi:hypothetical protein
MPTTAITTGIASGSSASVASGAGLTNLTLGAPLRSYAKKKAIAMIA